MLLLVIACGSGSISSSHAATGDQLIITGNIVNLRAAPSTDAASPIKLLKDRKVIEIQRQGDWVEVKTNREDIKSGWIYKTLITKLKKKESAEEKRFRIFKQRFTAYKENVRNQNGIPQFKEVIDKGEGTLHVIATESWLATTHETRGVSLTEVFKLWSAVVPVGSSLTVIVLDEQGEQHTMMMR
ncbi:MAG: hypothetical protein ACI85N_001683 [Gammaproteobacteria bacterium]|jgi:hypothetical protein